MDTLYDTLFTYAMEHRASAFLEPFHAELRANQDMADHAMDALRAMGAEAAGLAGRVEEGLHSVSDLNERCAFLSGLSMGLELGQLAR